MCEDVVIEPMSEEFIVWRCLHSGPLSHGTIDQWPSGLPVDWESIRPRNIPLLRELTRAYGACAILARADDRIVAVLYPYTP